MKKLRARELVVAYQTLRARDVVAYQTPRSARSTSNVEYELIHGRASLLQIHDTSIFDLRQRGMQDQRK